MTKFHAIVAVGAMWAASAEAGEPTPLFASDAPIELTLSAPWRTVARASPDDGPYDGELTVGAETLAVKISTRGKSRRERHVCDFPPLRIAFAERPPAGSLFHKQESLKLTTYCRKPESHQQVVLKEYAAYRLYNAATPQSFRARLASVAYVDAKSGRTEITRSGFFLEDTDDLAKRVGMDDIERGATPVSTYDQAAAARAALFNYMIGNLDWSMVDAPAGADCCHNVKIIGASETTQSNLVPVPYDFDMSGLVDAPYAVPPPQFRINSVRSRVFRGFCAHNAETRAVAADFRERRAAFETALATTPGLSEQTLKKARAYLDGYFTATATDEAVEKNVVRNCRS